MTSTHLKAVRLLAAFGLLAGALPVSAAGEVAAEIHELCIKAADYRGCVEAQKGATEYVGNKCLDGYAYTGNGNCQKVDCLYTWWGRVESIDRQHDSLVAGKSTWKCPTKMSWGIIRTGVMQLGAVSPITSSEECPPVEPKIGWNSSCEHAKPGWKENEAEAKRPKCDAKLVPYECNWNAYLNANPATKAWAEANPSMAEQERIRMTADPKKK